MSRKHFLSMMIFICSYLLTYVPLAAQEEQGEIIIISERVGKEIDQEENNKFKLFEGIKGFQSAVYIKLPDGRYFLKITYLDENTGELKIRRIQQSEASIKNRGHYIDHFENLQARKEEEERGSEIIILSERVGVTIDREERDKYKLFQDVKGFQSAVFLKLPDNSYILKIVYKEEKTRDLKVDRIQESKDSINNIRNSIDHFGEKQAYQDTVYQKPGTAFYLELGGRGLLYSANVDFRIIRSSAIGFGILVLPDVFMINSTYYLLLGKKYSKFEIGCGIEYPTNGGAFYYVVLGYRYQKKNGRLFRISCYLLPQYFSDPEMPSFLLGISFGHSF